ncbi:MAG: MFS transporter [Simkaniaceae bacterium]
MANTKNHKVIKWIVWSLSVLFLFYEFILRVFPSVMVEDLMTSFEVDAAKLGLLSAFYFYAYAPLQLPVGLLMDRFGARKLLSLAALICGLGAFLFGITLQISIAEIGRFFMGVGSSFAFVGMIYICSHWFLGHKLALLIGLGNSIGMLGAVGGEGPLGYLVDYYGWRPTVLGLAVIGILLAFIIYFTFRMKPPAFVKKENTALEKVNLWQNLKEVCKNYQTWVNAFVALFFYGTTAAYASLWGVPYLSLHWGLSREAAGFTVSLIFIGWIIGGPIIGIISDRLRKRLPIIQISTLLACLSILPIVYWQGLNMPFLYLCHFLLGAFSAAQLLNFSLSVELNNFLAKGTAIALTNMIVAFGSSFFQPFIGYLLDVHSPLNGEASSYTLSDFRFAFTALPISFLIAFLLSFFIKETKKGEERPI